MSVFLRQHYVVLPASSVGSTIVTVVRITRWYSTSQTRYISKTIGAPGVLLKLYCRVYLEPVYGLRFSARYPSFSVLMLVLYVLHGSTKSMGFSCVEYGGDSTSDKIEQQASDGGRPRSRRMFCFTHRRLVLWLHNEGETYLSNNGDLRVVPPTEPIRCNSPQTNGNDNDLLWRASKSWVTTGRNRSKQSGLVVFVQLRK